MDGDQKTAIILGATGLTGGELLHLLLDRPGYGSIKLFSRASVGITHPKLKEYIGDLTQLEAFKDQFVADEVFCCIGTTKAKTPDKMKYREIDFGIPVTAARLSKENGIPTFVVISALGANPSSKIFYNRTKGAMEQAVLEANIGNTYILRPSLIAGDRKEWRLGEWLARQFMRVLNLVLVGPLDKYRSIDPETIARCMIWLANHTWEQRTISSDEIRRIAAKNTD